MAKAAGGGRPAYGAECRSLWRLAPGLAYLNHGAYGLTPNAVLAEQARLRTEMERDPVRFLDPHRLREGFGAARTAIAPALGVPADSIAFVENATAGINAVLRSFRFAPGDRVVTTDQTHAGVRAALHHIVGGAGGQVVEVPLPWPGAEEDALAEAVGRALEPGARLAVFDHIASRSALLLPVERLTALAHARGVPVAIDGAHAPGMIALDLPSLGADWYVGNLHKWHFAPRGCAVLWAQPGAAPAVHPAVVSYSAGPGMERFDWTGTRDLTAVLSVPEAVAFHGRLGGAGLMARNRGLADEAGRMLADAWGTELAGTADQRLAMASVRLPGGLTPDFETATRFHDQLRRRRIQVPVHPIGGALWLRISAQAYNEMAEYRRLADEVLRQTPGRARRSISRAGQAAAARAKGYTPVSGESR